MPYLPSTPSNPIPVITNTGPVVPPSSVDVFITGITTLSGTKKVLLQVTEKGKQPDYPPPLVEGDGQGRVEVVSIDPDKGAAVIKIDGKSTEFATVGKGKYQVEQVITVTGEAGAEEPLEDGEDRDHGSAMVPALPCRHGRGRRGTREDPAPPRDGPSLPSSRLCSPDLPQSHIGISALEPCHRAAAGPHACDCPRHTANSSAPTTSKATRMPIWTIFI